VSLPALAHERRHEDAAAAAPSRPHGEVEPPSTGPVPRAGAL
jgi:hypothetical protein